MDEGCYFCKPHRWVSKDYQFNPKAITVPEKLPAEEPNSQAPSPVLDPDHEPFQENGSPNCPGGAPVRNLAGMFTEDEVLRYQRRYEEKYDIFTDKNYVEWLCIYYPDVSLLRQHRMSSVLQRYQASSLLSTEYIHHLVVIGHHRWCPSI